MNLNERAAILEGRRDVLFSFLEPGGQSTLCESKVRAFLRDLRRLRMAQDLEQFGCIRTESKALYGFADVSDVETAKAWATEA